MKNMRLLLILALAIISGLAAGYAALQYLSDRPQAIVDAGEGETIPVVLASRDLPLGAILEEGDLKVVEWPAGSVPIGFVSTREELLGEALIGAVQMNQAILGTNLGGGLVGIRSLIEPGMKALAVRVDEIIGVAGFATPQTRVDVILIAEDGGELRSQIILQNILVLSANQQIQETENGEAIVHNVATVSVTPNQAEKLSLASSYGELRLALRHPLDTESLETSGERASRLFAVGVGASRPSTRPGGPSVSPRENIVEVWRGGVRTLVRY